jgi:hypothetical protein
LPPKVINFHKEAATPTFESFKSFSAGAGEDESAIYGLTLQSLNGFYSNEEISGALSLGSGRGCQILATERGLTSLGKLLVSDRSGQIEAKTFLVQLIGESFCFAGRQRSPLGSTKSVMKSD